ncbi:MAG TPA: hypothetical protein VIS52_02845, partial [Motiliproteus sp.]
MLGPDAAPATCLKPLLEDPVGCWHSLQSCASDLTTTATLVAAKQQLLQREPHQIDAHLRRLALTQASHLQPPPSAEIQRIWNQQTQLCAALPALLAYTPSAYAEELALGLVLSGLGPLLLQQQDTEGYRQLQAKHPNQPALRQAERERYGQDANTLSAASIRSIVPHSLIADAIQFADHSAEELLGSPVPLLQCALLRRLVNPNAYAKAEMIVLADELGIDPASLGTLQQRVSALALHTNNQQQSQQQRLQQMLEAHIQALSYLQPPPPVATSPWQALLEKLQSDCPGPLLLFRAIPSPTLLRANAASHLPLAALTGLDFPLNQSDSLLARCAHSRTLQRDPGISHHITDLQIRRLMALETLLYLPLLDGKQCLGVAVMPSFTTSELDTLNGGHLSRSASLFLTALQEQERRQHHLAAAARAHCNEQVDSLRRDLATPLNTAHNYFHLLQYQNQAAQLHAPLSALGNALSELHQRLQPNGERLEHPLDLNTELLRLIDDRLAEVRVEAQLSPDLPHLECNDRAIRRLLNNLFTALGNAVTTGSRVQL